MSHARDPHPGALADGRQEGVRCGVCHGATWFRKPACLDHIEAMPYVARLLERMGEDERERAEVLAHGVRAVDLAGVGARDVLARLTEKPATVERLARETNQPTGLTRRYVEALGRAGLVSTSRTRRGSTMVELEEETVAEKIACEACGETFLRKTKFGKRPKYCSRACQPGAAKSAGPTIARPPRPEAEPLEEPEERWVATEEPPAEVRVPPEMAQAIAELEAAKDVILALRSLDVAAAGRVLEWVAARLASDEPEPVHEREEPSAAA